MIADAPRLEPPNHITLQPRRQVAMPSGRRCSLLGMRIDELNYECVTNRIKQWATTAQSRYMCISTVHMVMEAYDDAGFRKIVNDADIVGADGIPIIRVSRWLGLTQQNRVFAPELVVKLCDQASKDGITVGFYGSTPDVLHDIVERMKGRFSDLNVAYYYSPPFRPLTSLETVSIIDEINRSGVQILFVGLGCPRQERWMSEMRFRVNAVMIGVGWAFDVVAGHSRVAPRWIQDMGMEWFFRLMLNPKKLWRRHLKNNPRFILLTIRQFCNLRSS